MKYEISFKKQLLMICVIIAIVSNMVYFTTAKQKRMDSQDGIERKFNGGINEEARSSAGVFSVENRKAPDSTERGLTIRTQE
jgi:hypothetical protein